MMEVTKLVPTGKVEPCGGEEVTLVTVQPFIAGSVQVTLDLLHWPGSALAKMSDGQVKSRQSVATTTWSMSEPLTAPVMTRVSEAGQGGPMRQVDCATTHWPKEVVSMVCCCCERRVPPEMETVALLV